MTPWIRFLALSLVLVTSTRADSDCRVDSNNINITRTPNGTADVGSSSSYELNCTATVTCDDNNFPDTIVLSLGRGQNTNVTATLPIDMSGMEFSVSLTINSPISVADAGVYVCSATINETLANSTEFSFDVQLPTPDVVVSDVQGTQGMDADISCNVTFSPATSTDSDTFIRVMWSSDNLFSLDPKDFTAVTSVVDTRMIPSNLSNAGEYTCNASVFYNGSITNVINSTSQSDSGTVSIKIQTPSVSVSDNLAKIGDPATLVCNVTILDDNSSLTNASISWMPDNGGQVGDIERNGNVFTSNYQINPVSSSNAVQYNCSATVVAADASNNNIILPSEAASGIGTLYSADMIQSPPNTSVVLDTSPYNIFTTQCTLTNYPDDAPNTPIVSLSLTSTNPGDTDSDSEDGALDSNTNPLVSTRSITVAMAEPDSEVSHQYTCNAMVNVSGVGSITVQSNTSNVTVRGPTNPVPAVLLEPINIMNTTATIRWRIPRVSYTPETYVVHFGLSQDNLNNMSEPVNGNINDGSFLTDENLEYMVTLENLTSNTQYWYLVNSSNTAGSTVSVIDTFTAAEGAPTPPQNFVLATGPAAATVLRLTWSEPAMTNGDILYYNYTCIDTNSSADINRIGFTGPSTFTADITDLQPFIEYMCNLTASTSAGTSDLVTDTVVTGQAAPSGRPTQFNISSSNDNPNQLTLSWMPPELESRNGIITMYYYNCSNDTYSTDEGSTMDTTATVDGLAVFTNYTCTVRAATSEGRGPLAVFDNARTGEAAPSAVRNLSFNSINETSFNASWDIPEYPNGIITRYNITVVDYANPSSRVHETDTIALSSIVSGSFSAGNPYYVNVTAITGGGEGPVASILIFTEEGTPAQVQGIMVERISDTEANVSWTRLTQIEAAGFFNNLQYRVTLTPVTDTRKRQLSSPITQSFSSSVSSGVVTGLDGSTSYSVTVAAVIGEDKIGPTLPPFVVEVFPTSAPATSVVPIVIGVVFGLIVLVLVVIVLVLLVLLVMKRMHQTKDPEVLQNLAVLDSKRDEEDGDSNELKLLSVKQNPEFSERMQAVPIDDFADHVRQLHMNRDLGFEEEYESLKNIPIGSFAIAKRQANLPKNRFDNVYSYDDSRVVLPADSDGSDYINASFIDGYNHPKAFIAAQGPLVTTVVDFWRMVWEFQLPTVVMLTELIERGIEKCTCYYPRNTNETLDVGGGFQVTCIEQQQFVEYKYKKFLLLNTNKDGGRLDVTHYHFLAWPDHGVPADKTVMMAFARRVRQTHPPEGPPLIVHCSAGVGRTGTFIVLDTMMQRIEKKEGSLNIYELVADMRSKRTLMVQTMAQYIYTHDALSEYIICGDTSITTKGLRDKMAELSKVSGGTSGYQKQLELLNQISRTPSEGHCSDSLSKQNAVKNRYSQVISSLPYNETRVRLRTTSGVGDYINASIVDGYKHKGAFLATQVPLESTMADLWRMVWEQWSASIVMLCCLEEDESFKCYWPTEMDKKAVYGMIEVKLVSEKEEKDFIVRKFELSQESNYVNLATGNADKLVVTQYHYTKWPADGKPTNSGTLLELLNQLLKTQKLSGNKAITVMCNNGIDRTGAFLCLYSQLERVKVEGISDVFQFVKASRFNRAGLVQSLDNYIFCHELLLEFLNSFDQYENFK